MYSSYGAFELKARYQRNLVLGIIAATLPFVCVAIVVLFLPPHSQFSTGKAQSKLVVAREADELAAQASRPFGGGMGDVDPQIVGFNASIRVISDCPDMQVAPTSAALVPSPMVEEAPAASITDVATENAPVSDDTLFSSLDNSFVTQDSNSVETPESHDVVVLQRTDPEYPLVALERRKEGQVTLRVCIGSDGRLVPFEVETIRGRKRLVQNVMYAVVREDPEGFFFAKSLVKVLPEWVFQAKVENGVPLTAQLDITYSFVLKEAALPLFERQHR